MMKAYIGLSALAVSATTIKDAVIACGFSIGTVSGAWTYITSNYNKYRELARKADNYYCNCTLLSFIYIYVFYYKFFRREFNKTRT